MPALQGHARGLLRLEASRASARSARDALLLQRIQAVYAASEGTCH
jgi:hypothetical protein